MRKEVQKSYYISSLAHERTNARCFCCTPCMQVAAMQMMFLGAAGAEELLRPYRGVVSYHADAVRHLKSGNCVALQIEVLILQLFIV